MKYSARSCGRCLSILDKLHFFVLVRLCHSKHKTCLNGIGEAIQLINSQILRSGQRPRDVRDTHTQPFGDVLHQQSVLPHLMAQFCRNFASTHAFQIETFFRNFLSNNGICTLAHFSSLLTELKFTTVAKKCLCVGNATINLFRGTLVFLVKGHQQHNRALLTVSDGEKIEPILLAIFQLPQIMVVPFELELLGNLASNIPVGQEFLVVVMAHCIEESSNHGRKALSLVSVINVLLNRTLELRLGGVHIGYHTTNLPAAGSRIALVSSPHVTQDFLGQFSHRQYSPPIQLSNEYRHES